MQKGRSWPGPRCQVRGLEGKVTQSWGGPGVTVPQRGSRGRWCLLRDTGMCPSLLSPGLPGQSLPLPSQAVTGARAVGHLCLPHCQVHLGPAGPGNRASAPPDLVVSPSFRRGWGRSASEGSLAQGRCPGRAGQTPLPTT